MPEDRRMWKITVTIALVAFFLVGGCTGTAKQEKFQSEVGTQPDSEKKPYSNDTASSYSITLEKPPFLDDER